MRHLITFLLLVAAFIAYMAGWGPLFFGAPLMGSVLCAGGLILEVMFWRRVIHPVHNWAPLAKKQ